jgi:hypothetical protein
MAGYVRNALPGIYPAVRFGPNRERRAEAARFLREIEEELGRLSLRERLACWGTVPLSGWSWLTGKLGLLQQPRLLRVEHRLPAAVHGTGGASVPWSGRDETCWTAEETGVLALQRRRS